MFKVPHGLRRWGTLNKITETSTTTHTLHVCLAGSRRDYRPSMGRAQRKTRRAGNAETKSGGTRNAGTSGITKGPVCLEYERGRI